MWVESIVCNISVVFSSVVLSETQCIVAECRGHTHDGARELSAVHSVA